MNKFFLKSLRVFAVLFLVLFYAALVFGGSSVDFYIHGKSSALCFYIVSVLSPWIFPLFSLLAGVFSAETFARKDLAPYIAAQSLAFLLPAALGVALLAPVQSYIADLSRGTYTGAFFAHYKLFFGRLTDLSGFDGAFSAANFELVLDWFAFSLLALVPAMLQKSNEKTLPDKLLLALVYGFFALFFVTPQTPHARFGFWQNLVAFFFGFFVVSNESVQELLTQRRHWFAAAWCALMVLFCFIESTGAGTGNTHRFVYNALCWASLVSGVALCRRYFSRKNAFAEYASGAFFAGFYVAQTAAVVSAFFVLKLAPYGRALPVPAAFAAVFALSLAFVAASHELFRRAKRLLCR